MYPVSCVPHLSVWVEAGGFSTQRGWSDSGHPEAMKQSNRDFSSLSSSGISRLDRYLLWFKIRVSEWSIFSAAFRLGQAVRQLQFH